MNHSTTSPHKRQRGRAAALTLSAALAFSGVAFGLAGPAANAVSSEPQGGLQIAPRAVPEGGWGNPIEYGNLHLGGYVIENGPAKGTVAWCPQLGKPNPLNNQLPGKVVTSIKNGAGQTVSGLALQRLNATIQTYGQKIESPSYDAAVAIAVWYFSGDVDRNGVGTHGEFAGVNLLTVSSIPAQYRADVRKFFNQFVDRIESTVTGAQTSIADPAKPVLKLTEDGRAATITVPAGNGTVKLTGATVADGGSATITKAGTYTLTPQRPNDTTARWDIGYSSSGTINERGNIAAVTLHAEPSGEQQTIISAAGASRTWSHSGKVGIDQTVAIEGDSQAVDRIVKPGQPYKDEITLNTIDGKPWPMFTSGDRAGQPMPIPVRMSRYESSSEHVEGEIPAGAKPVEELTVVVDGGGKPTVVEGQVAKRGGGTHSNWVMTIDTTDKSVWTDEFKEMRAFLPEGYRWQHTYGLERESQVTPMSVEVHTELSKDTLSIDGDKLHDVQTVAPVAGEWLTVDGKKVPTVWKNEVYFVPGATKQKLERSTDVPKEAQLLQSYTTEVADEGAHKAPEITTPKGQVGAVTIRACLDPSKMDESVRDLVEPVCEDFGVQSQSASIVAKAAPALATTGGDSIMPTLLAGVGGAGVILGGILLLVKRRSAKAEATE